MAKLDFDIGSRVHCKDGECGKLHKVVVDPHTQRVTDLVVERGFLITTDRILPADLVDYTRNGDVYLEISGDSLAAYPEYREVEFEEPAPSAKAGAYDRRDIRCWPGAYRMTCTQPVVPMVKKQIHEGVGADRVVVERGTPVKNAQGTIGVVDHVLVDAQSSDITHLVIKRGLNPYYPIVPLSEVREVSDEAVTVGLAENEIDRFVRYRSRSANDIRAELRDRLAGLGFDLTLIQIDVEGSIVRLTGWVSSVAAKRHADAVARAVEGVIDVENLLDTDISLQTRVLHALLTDPRTNIATIEVINERRVVTLRGQVDSDMIRAAAEEIAARQPGVLSVVNALEVEPDEFTKWFAARSFALELWSEKTDLPAG